MFAPLLNDDDASEIMTIVLYNLSQDRLDNNQLNTFTLTPYGLRFTAGTGTYYQ